MKIVSLLLLALAASTSPATPPPDHDYLDVQGRRVQTRHRLDAAVEIAPVFKPLGETHHRPVFDGKRFAVSVAAFADGDRFVMVHAEELVDGGGTLDYGALAKDALGDFAFTSRRQCAELPPDVIASEHDLRFLAERGFDPAPALALKQFFVTSADRNAELVLTYGERVAGCPAASQVEIDSRLDARAREAFRVLRLVR